MSNSWARKKNRLKSARQPPKVISAKEMPATANQNAGDANTIENNILTSGQNTVKEVKTPVSKKQRNPPISGFLFFSLK